MDAINKGDWKPESTDGFDRIASVDTPDSLTAVVHYKEVYAPYKLQFFRGTLPKHLLEGRDIDKANDYNRNPLGTGPYRVAEWKTGEYVLLEKVKDYWRGPEYPKINRILFRFVTNTTTRINQLKAGEVHLVALVPWDKVRELKSVPSLRLNQVLGNGYEHVTLNEKRFPPFADVRVRRALAHAIDRDLIVGTILDSLVTTVERSDSAAVVGVRAEGRVVRARSGQSERAARRSGMEARRRTACERRTASRSRSRSSRRLASPSARTSRRRSRNSSRTSASTRRCS